MILISRFLHRNRKKLLTTSVSILFVLGLLQSDFGQEFSWGPVANVSCHYTRTNQSLPLLATSLPHRSIFFHETSCPGNLTARQVCAIESAARAHPAWQINVIFSGPIYTDTVKGIRLLGEMKNVKFWKVNIEEFAKNTLLEGLVSSRILKRCRLGVERTTDVLKYLSLYKFGGIYLDLDIIIARPLGTLARNWAARENDEIVADGLLSISKDSTGQKVAEEAIRYIESNYKNSDWCNDSPNVMTKVLQKLCSTPDASYMSSATCNDFEVYGPQFFYPIKKQSVREYFVPGELRAQNAYSYHMWGQITKKYKIMKSSPYFKLAKRFCPKAAESLFSKYKVKKYD